MSREQRPSGSNWLYKEENGIKIFASAITLPDGAEEWDECTQEEKEAWEKAQSQPEETE